MVEKRVKFQNSEDVEDFVKAAGQCDFDIDILYDHIADGVHRADLHVGGKPLHILIIFPENMAQIPVGIGISVKEDQAVVVQILKINGFSRQGVSGRTDAHGF